MIEYVPVTDTQITHKDLHYHEHSWFTKLVSKLKTLFKGKSTDLISSSDQLEVTLEFDQVQAQSTAILEAVSEMLTLEKYAVRQLSTPVPADYATRLPMKYGLLSTQQDWQAVVYTLSIGNFELFFDGGLVNSPLAFVFDTKQKVLKVTHKQAYRKGINYVEEFNYADEFCPADLKRAATVLEKQLGATFTSNA